MSLLGNPETSIDSRLDAVMAKLDAEEKDAAAPAEGSAAPEQAAGSESATADESAPESAETAPETTPASDGSDKGATEPASPAIEAPASWKAELKDRWKALPPDLQRDLAQWEQERHSGVNQKLQEAAERRKAADAALQSYQQQAEAVAQERQRYVQFAETLKARAYQLDPEIQTGIKTDWVQLWQQNPAEAGLRRARFEQRVGEVNAWVDALAKEQGEALEKAKSEAGAKMQAKLKEEEAALIAKIPEWSDAEVGHKGMAEVRGALVDRYGFNPNDVQLITDHKAVLVARDALRYHAFRAELDALKAAEAERQKAAKTALQQKRVAEPGKVQKPNPASDPKATPSERSKALLQQAKKTRSLNDRAALIAAAIG